MKKVLIIIGVVIVVLIVVVSLFMGNIVKTAIETVGPQVAGVPMTVEKVRISPFGGVVHVKKLLIGNPEGYKTSSAMELVQFKVNLDMASLFSDTIVIKEILIEAPQVTYERGLKASNLSTLLDNLEGEEKPEKEKPEEEPKEKKKPGKKVIIEDFQFNDAQVNATFTAMGGKKLAIPLPAIHMTDIGKESDGASVVDVISEVLGKVVSSIGTAATDALKGAGNMAGEALGGATGAAGDALSGAGDTAGKALDGAGDAAKGAADSLKKGLGGLLGGKKE